MFKSLLFAVGATGLALAGCNSFNEITYVALGQGPSAVVQKHATSEISGLVVLVPTTPIDPGIAKIPPVTPPDDVASRTQGLCPVYRLPALPPAPVAPLSQLNAIAPTDTASVDALTRAHIIELHRYIDQTRQLLIRSYQDYVKHCQQHRKTAARHSKS
jgi:hypothetical protein